MLWLRTWDLHAAGGLQPSDVLHAFRLGAVWRIRPPGVAGTGASGAPSVRESLQAARELQQQLGAGREAAQLEQALREREAQLGHQGKEVRGGVGVRGGCRCRCCHSGSGDVCVIRTVCPSTTCEQGPAPGQLQQLNVSHASVCVLPSLGLLLFLAMQIKVLKSRLEESQAALHSAEQALQEHRQQQQQQTAAWAARQRTSSNGSEGLGEVDVGWLRLKYLKAKSALESATSCNTRLIKVRSWAPHDDALGPGKKQHVR